MLKLTTYAFVAALLVAGLAMPTIAAADCSGPHSTKSVDNSTQDTSVADSSASQGTKQGGGN